MIDRRVPTRVSQFIRWLRKPSAFAVRLVVALLLIVGGFFSFLPILGLWMLPLGLLFTCTLLWLGPARAYGTSPGRRVHGLS